MDGDKKNIYLGVGSGVGKIKFFASKAGIAVGVKVAVFSGVGLAVGVRLAFASVVGLLVGEMVALSSIIGARQPGVIRKARRTNIYKPACKSLESIIFPSLISSISRIS